MKLVIGSDHGGFALKENIKGYLQEEGIEFTDYGTLTPERCDYPVIAKKVAEAVADGTFDRGILICGTGIGIGIAALSIDFSLKIHELISIHQFHLVCNLVHSPGCGEIDFRLAFGTLLCCNHNDTVGSAGSVNSCCRSIFEDVDGFDIC